MTMGKRNSPFSPRRKKTQKPWTWTPCPLLTDEEGSMFQLQEDWEPQPRTEKNWQRHLYTNPDNDCPTAKGGKKEHDGRNGKRSIREGFLKRRTAQC